MPEHRKGVAYRDAATNNKYRPTNPAAVQTRENYRGDTARPSTLPAVNTGSPTNRPLQAGPAVAQPVPRPTSPALAQPSVMPGTTTTNQLGASQSRDRDRDRTPRQSQGQGESRPATISPTPGFQAQPRPATISPTPAFQAQPRPQVQMESNRGQASRQQMNQPQADRQQMSQPQASQPQGGRQQGTPSSQRGGHQGNPGDGGSQGKPR